MKIHLTASSHTTDSKAIHLSLGSTKFPYSIATSLLSQDYQLSENFLSVNIIIIKKKRRKDGVETELTHMTTDFKLFNKSKKCEYKIICKTKY